MGCIFAVFRLAWKIIKLALKIAWKILRFLLFRLGLIFPALYLLGAFIVERTYESNFSFSGAGKWLTLYWVGLGLSILCTILVLVRRATKKKNKERR